MKIVDDRNRLAVLAQFNDRVADSRQVVGEDHKYEVVLKLGWLYAGAGYDGEYRRYESFRTKREMIRVVKAARREEVA